MLAAKETVQSCIQLGMTARLEMTDICKYSSRYRLIPSMRIPYSSRWPASPILQLLRQSRQRS